MTDGLSDVCMSVSDFNVCLVYETCPGCDSVCLGVNVDS